MLQYGPHKVPGARVSMCIHTLSHIIAKGAGIICRREKRNCMPDEREIRLQRLQTLREQGINPYPNSVERTHTIDEVLQHFNEWEGPQGSYTLVGRVRLLRDMGKAAFTKIEDGSGRI